MAQINTLKGVYGFGSSPNRKHMIMAFFGVFHGLPIKGRVKHVKEGLNIQLGLRLMT